MKTIEVIWNFASANATLSIAFFALCVSVCSFFVSWRSYRLNARTKAEADRVKLFEKRREILSEVASGNAQFGTYLIITMQKLILFLQNSNLREEMPGELERLGNNLEAIQKSRSLYEEQRRAIERIDSGVDVAWQEELLASMRSRTIWVSEEIANEGRHLNELRERIKSSSGV